MKAIQGVMIRAEILRNAGPTKCLIKHAAECQTIQANDQLLADWKNIKDLLHLFGRENWDERRGERESMKNLVFAFLIALGPVGIQSLADLRCELSGLRATEFIAERLI